MGLFNNWIYLDEHELNLDWIIRTVRRAVDNVKVLNLSFDELKDYVENYFKNLDISEEVSNKIESMAESGELEELIIQVLELKSLLSYDTATDLEKATNVIEGSNAIIMGKELYNDGLSALYHIRALEPTDVIDGDRLIALINYPELVAEKLPDNSTKELEREILVSQLLPESSAFMWGVTKDARNNKAHANGGMCYHDNTLYLAYTSNNNTEVTIERVTMDGVTTLATYTANLGHVNSITFNPVLNKLVVANVTNQLYLLDENLQSLTVFDLSTLGIDEIGEVAYDSVREVMILGSYNLYIVDAAMTEVITRITTPEVWDGYPQGLTVLDGLVVRNFNNKEKIRYEYIDEDFTSITLLNSAQLPNIMGGVLLGELEDVELANINNKIVLFATYTTLWDSTSYTSVWKSGDAAATGQDRPNIDRNIMYVDIAYTGLSTGSLDKPFKSLTEAITHSYQYGAEAIIDLLSDIEEAKHNNFFNLKGISLMIRPQVNITRTIAISNANHFTYINPELEQSGNLNLLNIDRLYIQLTRHTGIIQAIRVQGEIEAFINRFIVEQSIITCQRNITTLEGSQGSIITANAITTQDGFTRGLSVVGVQKL